MDMSQDPESTAGTPEACERVPWLTAPRLRRSRKSSSRKEGSRGEKNMFQTGCKSARPLGLRTIHAHTHLRPTAGPHSASVPDSAGDLPSLIAVYALFRGVIEIHAGLSERAAIVPRTWAAPASIDNAVAESMQTGMATMRKTSLQKISLFWRSGRGGGDRESGLDGRNEDKQEERG
ncbi:hypothetical protein GY45DRAFT_674709 [Cubamyces sp. BRFM 1775]|nr:hypothetical protein GY45DRAFT_674709 [Cubamyces sp. BRFM 1775]